MRKIRTSVNAGLFVCLLIIGIAAVATGDARARVWHVCMECEDGDAKTIGEAIRQAEPRDTILVYWEPRFPYYMESLVIDKPLRIISYPAAGDVANYDLYPVITAQGKRIIHITVPGVELIGFNIMFLEKPVIPEEDSVFDHRVGIWLDAPALIRHCAITNCSAGIVTAYTGDTNKTGSRIEMCRIGLPADHGLAKENLKQTRNLYGLVLLGTIGVWQDKVLTNDRISDSQIMRNAYYGVIHTPNNPPVMQNNLVELNVEGPFRLAMPGLDDTGRLKWITMQKMKSPSPEPPVSTH